MKKKFLERRVTKQKMNWMLIVLLLCGLTTWGTAEEKKTLTLSQAIKIALKNNPELKQVSNQVQLNQISFNQKKNNFYPDLSLSANSSQQYFKTVDSQTGGAVGEDSRYLNVNVSTNINLFNGFYDIASLQQSKFELEAAEGNFSRSSQAIIFETLSRYIQVLTSRELIKVEKENLEAQQLQLNRIEDFYKAGRRPITDLYQQKAEISKSAYQLLNSKRNYQINKLLLLQTLGLEPDTHYQVSDLGFNSLIEEIQTFNKEKVLNEALSKRSDLEAQQLQIQAAQKAVKAARAGYWPKLSLFAELATNYNSLDELANFSNQLFDNNLNATVGLSLSIPIFDKGVTKNSVAAAKINVDDQQLELVKLKNQVAVEVQQAVEDYRTAAQQVTAAETQFTYARASLESVEARYNVQAATMVELTQARTRYLEAAYDQVSAKYNLFIQAIAIAFYKGDINEVMALINR